MKKLVFVAGMVFALSVSAAEKIKVVTSFSILADFVAELGGDRVELVNLVGADEDAHVYQATPDDARALLKADLVIANGLGFEPWLPRLMSSTESPATYIEASKGVLPIWLEEDGEKVPDPHAWQSLAHAEIYVRNIAGALAKTDPANADFYEKQRVSYLERVRELLVEVRESLGRLPTAQRKVITSHDAFGYLGQAYGLTFVAPQGLSTESEPSAADVAALIRQIREDQVRAVFVENIRDPRLMERIAEEAGATVGGTLYSDALAASGPGSSYLGMYRHNVETLVEALQP
ncbi:MAG TPA: metal ABC transporter substrate-binding protein [Pseudomonas xinjiangensis]|uniref:Metal ABC transporter substrate-binding protein n=2 Tax=root TaxID=1 RepID=A0A7V1BTM1_9GAMM|nr:metal ABC transporter substrate-binding protein [Halopseudomonas xinjiangensis]HEC46977.1 metal ABC transporter substrate-binding protein [Halopseudomonas xinjiangensis]